MDAYVTGPLEQDRVNRLLLKYLDDGKEVPSVLQEILVTLRKSSIVPRGDETKWVRFWNRYNQEADEYDREFLERYKEDMNTTMIFSGLFTAVTATIASMTVSGLSQDPNVVMQVLLQNILISVNSTSGSIPQGIPLPEWNGPSVSIVWFQTLLYASLVCSLLVALGAVLATQWLSRYRAVDERGTIEDRGKRRQQKFDGLRVWGFRLFLEALPILLQFSLLLFGVSLCAYMWDQQRVIAAVLIFANGVGGLLWLFTLIVSAIYPESPYDTPLSDLLARMSHSKDVAPAAENFSPASTSASTVSPHTTSSQDQVSANCETRSTTAAVTAFGKPIPILNWVLTRWHRIRGRESVDPERADPQSQTPSSPPSRRTRLATRAPVDSRGENPVSPSSPVTHATHAAVSKVITKVFGPVVRTHKARLARSFPTLNEVRMAAFSWLMETSTDPEVHVNAFLVVPEIIWTDEQFTRESFSLQTLDFLLEKLAGCFQADGHPKGDNVERLVSLCASFFFIFWQLYRVASVTTHTWTQKSGLAFVRTHDAMVKALASMSLKTLVRPAEDTWILRLTYLTFQHFAEALAPQELVRVGFPSVTPPKLTPTPDSSLPSSTFTAPFRIRTMGLIHLAQVSYLDLWFTSNRITLFTEIIEYLNQGGVSASYFSLLATAILLGFEPEANKVLEWSHPVGELQAVEYLLDEIQYHISWNQNEDLRIAYVFGIDRKDERLSGEALKTLSGILRVLRSAAEIIPDVPASPSHFTWIAELLPALCHCNTVDLESIYHNVAYLVELLARMVDLSSHATDSHLHNALAIIAHLHPPDGLYSDNLSASLAFVQMQHTTLSFIHLLAEKGNFGDMDIPTFSPDTCGWDISQPPNSRMLFTLTEDQRDIIKERDTLVVSILQLSGAGAPDTSTRRAWFDDPKHDKLVRLWIHVVHRWYIPYHPILPGMISESSRIVSSLLDCARLRLPETAHWGQGGEIIRARHVAVVVLWRSWYQRLDAADEEEQTDFSELVESTIFLLGVMGPEEIVDVEWYLTETLSDFRRYLPFIEEWQTTLDTSLKNVQSAVERKLAELHKWKNGGITPDGDDTVNTNSRGIMW